MCQIRHNRELVVVHVCLHAYTHTQSLSLSLSLCYISLTLTAATDLTSCYCFIQFSVFLPQNFAVELQLENMNEFEIDHFREQLLRAGGANYGTGMRDP